MSVGFPQGKDNLDAQAGSVAFNTLNDLKRAADFNSYLLRVDNGTFLQSLGYTSTDITALRGLFQALSDLNDIAHARKTQPAANDFFFFGPQIIGPQFTSG
jgi:hypothetical protein